MLKAIHSISTIYQYIGCYQIAQMSLLPFLILLMLASVLPFVQIVLKNAVLSRILTVIAILTICTTLTVLTGITTIAISTAIKKLCFRHPSYKLHRGG